MSESVLEQNNETTKVEVNSKEYLETMINETVKKNLTEPKNNEPTINEVVDKDKEITKK